LAETANEAPAEAEAALKPAATLAVAATPAEEELAQPE